ncbi:ribonuclease HII [Enterococcus nangangensis]|uniref:ribonuclease HII n=1 Tax=Enterococcus nangangensis TaxID=2559926 RepID=UPI0010F86B08|nr:ribonuclease HII [Enterococcus nangangensis]
MSLTITQVKQLLQAPTVSPETLAQLAQDERKGVQQALKSFTKQQEKLAAKKAAFLARLSFERDLRQHGYQAIAGIDEVGRGPLAGPVVAAAVILPVDCDLLEVNDSKQLSLKKREELFTKIQAEALAIGIGIQDQDVIDRVNIYQATKLAMMEAVEKLAIPADYLLLDAMKLDLPLPQTSLIKGDARSVSIAAASIIAKVTRDHLMADYDKLYPGYGFAHNAGYGTAEHLAGLAAEGITPIHRKTFAPVKEYL